MKSNWLKISTWIVLLIMSFFIFRNWFFASEIIGGDWPYFFNEILREFSVFPPAWSAGHGNGLGGQIISYSLDCYLYFLTSFFVNGLHLPWEIVYKVFYFGLFLFLSIFSSIYLLKTVLLKAKDWQKLFSALIFTTNTYILMLVAGGQMGVALAYSLAPLVLAKFIDLIRPIGPILLRRTLLFSLVLALQVLFDPRIAYITLIGIFLYILWITLLSKGKVLREFFLSLLSSAFIVTGLNAFWLLPLFITRKTSLASLRASHAQVGAVKFFSFSQIENTLSLLHPNWPENIFGKTYFMRPEFLILPILAFSSLLFIKGLKSSRVRNLKNTLINNSLINNKISYFALLALLGAFLAKGANPPFGGVYLWLFQNFPGFFMFRDPTKFYLLAIVSYSVLIPFSLSEIQSWLRSKLKLKNKNHSTIQPFNNIAIVLFIFYWLFLIRPTWLGQLSGTFQKKSVPQEYLELKDFLDREPQFFRTLWIPRQHRFTYSSSVHPSVEGIPLFEATNSAEIISRLRTNNSQKYLAELSIKYIVVPDDPFGEIFLKDRKYDSEEHQEVIKELIAIDWLKKVADFNQIAVFEAPSPQDHFYAQEAKISYSMINPTRYMLEITNTHLTDLIFSENYSPYWLAKTGKAVIHSEKTASGVNSFRLNKTGDFTVDIYFSQQDYYHYGQIISFLALGGILGVFFLLKKIKNEKN